MKPTTDVSRLESFIANPRRALWTLAYAVSRGVVIAAVVGAIFYLTAPQLIGFFSDSTGIRQAGVGYLRVLVFAYPFATVSILAGRALQGMGYGLPLMVLTTTRILLISAPVAYVMVFWMDGSLESVWWAMVAGVLVPAGIAGPWLRWGMGRLEQPSPAG